MATLVIAGHHRTTGELGLADEVLSQALEDGVGRQEQIKLLLASVCDARGNFERAAALYDEVITEHRDVPEARRHVVALFRADRLEKAIELARRIRSGGPPVEVITEVEAAILERIGDLPGSLKLLSEILEASFGKPEHRLSAAMLCWRLGNPDQARAHVEHVAIEVIANDPVALVRFAELRHLLGMGSCLPAAYRAHLVGRDDPQIQLAYMAAVMRSSPDDELVVAPEEVGENTTVTLANDETSRVVTITTEPGLESEQWAIPSSDPLAMRLLGRRKNDSVEVRASDLETLVYRITEINSKYVAAFQRALADFGTRFPDNQSLHRVNVESGDFSAVFRSLDSHAESIERVREIYRTHGLPLAVVAKALGKSIVEVWQGFAEPGTTIACASGDPQEEQVEADLLTQSDSIACDLTGVLTLVNLDLEDPIADRFRRVLVPQAVVDELLQFLEQRQIGDGPSMVLARRGAGYIRTEVTREDLDREREFLQRAIDFVRTRCVVCPVRALLRLSGEASRLEEIGSAEGVCASLVALEERVPLVTDDFFVRALASNEWGVRGASVQSVMQDLAASDKISTTIYREALIRLALSSRGPLRFTHGDLMWLLGEENGLLTPRVTRVFETLRDDRRGLSETVAFVAGLIRSVCLEPATTHARVGVIDLVFRSIGYRTSDRSAFAARLVPALEQSMRLMPIHLDEAIAIVRLWERHAR